MPIERVALPGWVATDMGGSGGRSVQQGGASVVWAVTLPDDGPTGGFSGMAGGWTGKIPRPLGLYFRFSLKKRSRRSKGIFCVSSYRSM